MTWTRIPRAAILLFFAAVAVPGSVGAAAVDPPDGVQAGRLYQGVTAQGFDCDIGEDPSIDGTLRSPKKCSVQMETDRTGKRTSLMIKYAAPCSGFLVNTSSYRDAIVLDRAKISPDGSFRYKGQEDPVIWNNGGFVTTARFVIEGRFSGQHGGQAKGSLDVTIDGTFHGGPQTDGQTASCASGEVTFKAKKATK